MSWQQKFHFRYYKHKINYFIFLLFPFDVFAFVYIKIKYSNCMNYQILITTMSFYMHFINSLFFTSACCSSTFTSQYYPYQGEKRISVVEGKKSWSWKYDVFLLFTFLKKQSPSKVGFPRLHTT